MTSGEKQAREDVKRLLIENDSLRDEIEREEWVLKMQKISRHVPAPVYIKAKEDAGYASDGW